MENMKLSTFIKKYDEGYFSDNKHSMYEAGWYDWFCKDSSLYRRLKKMISCVKAVANSPLINPEKVYVFFKNNCPMSGPTYDSFSICELESEDVIYWITLKSGHTNEAELIVAPDFGENVLPKDKRTVKGIKNYFKGK